MENNENNYGPEIDMLLRAVGLNEILTEEQKAEFAGKFEQAVQDRIILRLADELSDEEMESTLEMNGDEYDDFLKTKGLDIGVISMQEAKAFTEDFAQHMKNVNEIIDESSD